MPVLQCLNMYGCLGNVYIKEHKWIFLTNVVLIKNCDPLTKDIT